MRRFLPLIPVAVFALLAAFFLKGLSLNPRDIPSVLIDRPMPEMDLPPLPSRGEGSGLATNDLKGRVSLVNVWGSWCVTCKVEHPFLMKLKAMNVVPIHGINWLKGEPIASQERWLAQFGDPYDRVGIDDDSGTARLDLGVTAAPETFVVDKNGVIRYKHAGAITPEVWEGTLLPIILELSK